MKDTITVGWVSTERATGSIGKQKSTSEHGTELNLVWSEVRKRLGNAL